MSHSTLCSRTELTLQNIILAKSCKTALSLGRKGEHKSLSLIQKDKTKIPVDFKMTVCILMSLNTMLQAINRFGLADSWLCDTMLRLVHFCSYNKPVILGSVSTLFGELCISDILTYSFTAAWWRPNSQVSGYMIPIDILCCRFS